MEKTKLLLVLIILAAFIIRLIISWQEITVLVEKILLDDSLYVISVARNIAFGNGMTYNGVDLTNGFQPLWGFLLVPIFLLTKDPNLAINLILTLASIIDTLTVFMIYKLTKKVFNEKIALLSAAFYGLNPIIMFQNLCGIELVLYMLLLITTLFYYINLEKVRKKDLVMLGVLLGLTVLTRMDGIFLALAIFLDMLWKDRKKLFSGFKKIFIVAAIAAALVAPWFLWSYLTFGTFVQSSAIAKYNMGHGIFPFFDLKEPKMLSDTLSLIGENFIRTGGSIAHQLGIVDFNINIITVSLSLLFAATLLLSIKFLKKLRVYVMFSVMLILFYNLYLWGVQIRYMTPIIPLFMILISNGFYILVSKIKKSDLLVSAFFVLFLLVIFLNGLKQWDNGYFSWQKEIYKDALWIRENTSSSTSIGVFSAGIPIYFSEKRVVDLDGVVNFKAIKALESKDVIGYMKSENITIWVDSVYFNKTITNDFLKGRKIDILKENIWVDFLGPDKDNLTLIDQREGVYKHLLGFDMLVVFFKAKVN
jgi:4-amino-4-deoxy-L-arabinose transferase-like glycosyltransferase